MSRLQPAAPEKNRLKAKHQRWCSGFSRLPLKRIASRLNTSAGVPASAVIKEKLRVKGYVRYMDDMVLWGESSEALSNHLQAITELLRSALGLEMNSPYINRVEHGIGLPPCLSSIENK